MFPSPAATRTIQRDCNKESTMISESATILIVEDEQDIRELLAYNLEKEGYATVQAADGKEGLELARSRKPDLILLDLMLPKMDGLAVCRELERDSGTVRIPIIMLTAKSEVNDRITGLEMGADDYLVKPFGTSELLARIRTAIRHTRTSLSNPEIAQSGRFTTGDLVIDYDKHQVLIHGENARLTANEYRIVSLLGKYAGKVLTYDFIIKELWGPKAKNDNQILRVNMANIRRKIEENPGQPKYIFTEVGVGYRMREGD